MLNMKKNRFLLISLLFLISFTIPGQRKIKLYLVGDSTMSVKEVKAYPETGWGMPFAYFFDSSVMVDNRARNGRSTKSFMAENLWQPIVNELREGDYVFIQFGHNDEAKEKAERYSPPELFKSNLLKYVSDTRSKKAIPVLITPVSRRRFDKDGKAIETHAEYSPLVKEIAVAQNVLLIDLDKKSQELYQQFGPENSKLLFLQLKPGEHPNYPEGKNDNTHFSELGARLIAQLVLAEIKSLKLELADRIVKPLVK
jgi:lysophospholipase L1-like esterase